MHASSRCGNGVHGRAKIDDSGPAGRIRLTLLFFAYTAAQLRMDAVSPFGVALATLTTDGNKFALSDLREKHFYVGPASACNLARLIRVPVPPHALVSVLRGQAPVLKHDPERSTLEWSPKGYYVLTLRGARTTEEEIHLAPHPDDLLLPWTTQRMRVLDIAVRQEGQVIYRAELKGHEIAETDVPLTDDLGIDPPIPPSGPECRAEVPRRIHLEVPSTGQDLLLQYEKVKWNPPLPPATFTQEQPSGLDQAYVTCE